MRAAFMSCDDLPRESPGHDRVVEFAPHMISIMGDYPYYTMHTSGKPLWGVATVAPVKGDNATLVQTHLDQHFSKPSIKRMMALRSTGTRILWTLDDHDLWMGNDWDHTLNQANSGDLPLGAVSQVEVNAHWWTNLQVAIAWGASRFDNPAPNYAANRDRPSSAVVGDDPPATQYPIRYFCEDYSLSGVYGGKDIRYIFTDSISYRSDRDAVESGSKHFLGPQQEAWLLDRIVEAANFRHIFIMSTKKLTKLQAGGSYGGFMGTGVNPDTFGAYTTARSRLLNAIHATGVRVIWLSGDQHHPHVMDARVSRGAPYDMIDVCACPMSVDLLGTPLGPDKGNPTYWRTEWIGQTACFGTIEVDNSGARVSVRNANTGAAVWSARFIPGSNNPIYDASILPYRFST